MMFDVPKFRLATRLFRSVARRWRDQAGSLTIELVLVVPLLVWVMLGMHILFDAFHKKFMSYRASETAFDLLSRQIDDPVDRAYLDGLQQVLEMMTGQKLDAQMRVTVVSYDAAQDRYQCVWSYPERPARGLVDQAFVDQDLRPHLPVAGDGVQQIVVETWARYEPPTFLFLPDEINFTDVTVGQLRYDPQLRCDDCPTDCAS